MTNPGRMTEVSDTIKDGRSDSDGHLGGWAGRAVLRIYGTLVYYGALVIFGVTAISISGIGTLFYLVLPKGSGAKVARRVLSWASRVFVCALRWTGVVKVECAALERLRRPGGVVIAPNHPCMIDAIFFISSLPDVVCIMKSGILRNPIFSGSARLAGYVTNDEPVAMVRESVKLLQSGCKLLVFPEGTRTVKAPVNRFQRSFAIVAKAAGSPVQVVYVETNSPCMGKGWPIFKVPRFPLRYRVTLGPKVEVPEGVDLKRWVTRFEEGFRKELEGKVAVVGCSGD